MTQTELLAIPQCQVKWNLLPSLAPMKKITSQRLSRFVPRANRERFAEELRIYRENLLAGPGDFDRTDLFAVINEVFGVSREELISRVCKGEAVLARHVFFWCHRVLYGKNQVETAVALDRKRNTVADAQRKFRDEYAVNSHFRGQFSTICDIMGLSALRESVNQIKVIV